MTHLLANFMKQFFSHYLPIQKGLSVNTILAYRDTIKLLLCYAADTLEKHVDGLAVEDIAEKLVVGFLDYVEQERGVPPERETPGWRPSKACSPSSPEKNPSCCYSAREYARSH